MGIIRKKILNGERCQLQNQFRWKIDVWNTWQRFLIEPDFAMLRLAFKRRRDGSKAIRQVLGLVTWTPRTFLPSHHNSKQKENIFWDSREHESLRPTYGQFIRVIFGGHRRQWGGNSTLTSYKFSGKRVYRWLMHTKEPWNTIMGQQRLMNLLQSDFTTYEPNFTALCWSLRLV